MTLPYVMDQKIVLLVRVIFVLIVPDSWGSGGALLAFKFRSQKTFYFQHALAIFYIKS